MYLYGSSLWFFCGFFFRPVFVSLISRQLWESTFWNKNQNMRTFLNWDLLIFQSNRPNLVRMKSIQTGEFFIKLTFVSKFIIIQKTIISRKTKITAMLCSKPYQVFLVVDRTLSQLRQPPPLRNGHIYMKYICAMCWNEWKLNFAIFIIRAIVKIHRKLTIFWIQRWL